MLIVPQASVLLLIVIDRPRKTPRGAYTIICSTALTQLTLQLNETSKLRVDDIPSLLATFAALAAVVVISCMPFRNRDLPHDDISAPFEKPSKDLRSPEDRLTPWQFASVAWMSPLIKVGCERQLNDEDVWQLPYQYQHHGLHERFRELKGSVIKRLLKANAIDLIIDTSFGMVEILCSKW